MTNKFFESDIWPFFLCGAVIRYRSSKLLLVTQRVRVIHGYTNVKLRSGRRREKQQQCTMKNIKKGKCVIYGNRSAYWKRFWCWATWLTLFIEWRNTMYPFRIAHVHHLLLFERLSVWYRARILLLQCIFLDFIGSMDQMSNWNSVPYCQ